MNRLFDFAISCIAITLTLPLTLTLAIFIRFYLGSPVFFRQQRAGKDGILFDIIKFRTMKNVVDSHGIPLPDNKRLSNFGQFLRTTSLDELPEFWNVIKGDMSLIGPRPLLPEYLPLYSEEQSRRHEVLPGITGWAQINGRNSISWEEKFKLDVYYVDNKSVFLDIQIIMLTLLKVFTRDGVSYANHATMIKFKGSRK